MVAGLYSRQVAAGRHHSVAGIQGRTAGSGWAKREREEGKQGCRLQPVSAATRKRKVAEVSILGQQTIDGKETKDAGGGGLFAGEEGCVYDRKKSLSSSSLLFHAEESAGPATGRRILGLATARRKRSGKGLNSSNSRRKFRGCG